MHFLLFQLIHFPLLNYDQSKGFAELYSTGSKSKRRLCENTVCRCWSCDFAYKLHIDETQMGHTLETYLTFKYKIEFEYSSGLINMLSKYVNCTISAKQYLLHSYCTEKNITLNMFSFANLEYKLNELYYDDADLLCNVSYRRIQVKYLKSVLYDIIFPTTNCNLANIIPLERGSGNYFLNHPDGLKKAVLTWSKYGQDLYVDNYFGRKENGFFIEIGCCDGEKFSNTLLLEKVRHWNGLLVEPSPRLYKQIKTKNRNCFISNACISAVNEKYMFIDVVAVSSNEAAKIKQNIGEYFKGNLRSPDNIKHVRCERLLDILEAIGQFNIDYFSLDIGSNEFMILNDIPWDKVNIELFTIKTDHNRQEISTFLKMKGYERTHRIRVYDFFRKLK